MSYNSHGAKGRRDANEPAIIKALEADGCLVRRIGDSECGDLLVFWRLSWGVTDLGLEIGLIEVKVPKGKMKPKQAEWAELSAANGIRYAIAHSPEEAQEAIERWRRGSR